jgi:streptogramin lyase
VLEIGFGNGQTDQVTPRRHIIGDMSALQLRMHAASVGQNEYLGGNRRMAPNRARLVVGLLTAFLLGLPPAIAEQPAGQLRVETEIPRRGDFMCVGFGSLWMMGHEKLMRIALTDNAVTEIPVIPVNGAMGEFRRTVVGEGAVWVADNKTIYKIDPNANLVVMTIPADFPVHIGAAGEIGVGEGAVWAITGSSYEQALRRYSTQTGAEQATIPLPSPSSGGVVVDFGSVWVAGAGSEELYRIDPTANKIIATIELRSRPFALASGEGSLWVRQSDGTVQRIDGNSGQVLATIATEAADQIGDMVVGGGFVWLNSKKVPLVQIDPETNSQRSKFDAPPGAFIGYTIGYGGGSLWLGGSAVFRTKPPE